MNKVLDYLRLILFVSGVLIGVQAPSFVEQYGKSLEAHYRESSLSLQAFENDAQRYFDGDLNKLIEHYQSNSDPVINAGGDNIRAIYSRNTVLAQARTAFYSSGYHAYMQVFFKPLLEIKAEVRANYTYSIVLNPSAIISGLGCGFMLSLIIELSALLAIKLWRRILQRPIQS